MYKLKNPIEKIITELSIKYNLSEDLVKSVIWYEFRFLKDNMQSGNFKPIQLMHLGKWIPSDKKKTYWSKRIKEENEQKVNADNRGLEECNMGESSSRVSS